MILVRGTATLALASVLVLAFGCASASPQGEVVVHGAHSGSHLELSVRGNSLIVEGWMGPKRRRRLPPRAHAASPSAGWRAPADRSGHGSRRATSSKSPNRLPVPLTVHLGDGSDKFIGNGEADTCYSEGARRNRCIGGAGNDICITGNENSDCVGDAGNDYCQTGAGSDGCWGGPGDDVCRMGAGQDGCHGEGGHDELYGGAGADQLYGGDGYDACDGLPGWGRSHECETGPQSLMAGCSFSSHIAPTEHEFPPVSSGLV